MLTGVIMEKGLISDTALVDKGFFLLLLSLLIRHDLPKSTAILLCPPFKPNIMTYYSLLTRKLHHPQVGWKSLASTPTGINGSEPEGDDDELGAGDDEVEQFVSRSLG